MPDVVILNVGGQRHEGWTNVSVTLSIEAIAGSFELGLTELWPDQPTRRVVKPGQECTLSIDDDLLITGRVDEAAPEYNAVSHSISITGRDATGDLVDCSALNEPGEWKNVGLVAIAASVCKPFAISVSAQTDTGKPFTRFAMQPGESAFEVIERACRARAVLPVSDGNGGLVFARAGTARRQTALVYGENIVQAEAAFSDIERYSQYIVRGQQPGDDSWGAQVASEPEARAEDPAIGRYRPLVILAEVPEGQSFEDRAKWEATVRAGRARKANYTVQGWRDEGGALWRPNALVKVDDTMLGINETMLITSVTFSRSEDGTTTQLSLVKPSSYELIALVDEEEDGLWTSEASVN